MSNSNDIILAVDYHDTNIVIRWFNKATGEVRMLKQATTRQGILDIAKKAQTEAQEAGGQAVWLMESTTGWARVKALVEPYVQFVPVNVLQIPLPPKARRKKTDKVDTARMLREALNGHLPEAFTPAKKLRAVRRLTASRESLASRRTALKNWIDRYLAHETWLSRTGLWSKRGIRHLRSIAASPILPNL